MVSATRRNTPDSRVSFNFMPNHFRSSLLANKFAIPFLLSNQNLITEKIDAKNLPWEYPIVVAVGVLKTPIRITSDKKIRENDKERKNSTTRKTAHKLSCECSFFIISSSYWKGRTPLRLRVNRQESKILESGKKTAPQFSSGIVYFTFAGFNLRAISPCRDNSCFSQNNNTTYSVTSF